MGPKIEANLLFSNNYYVRNISLQSETYNLVKEGFQEATGIAYDYKSSRVFVLDAGKQELVSLKLNTSLNTNVVVNTTVIAKNLGASLRSVAFDWISENIYLRLAIPRLYWTYRYGWTKF